MNAFDEMISRYECHNTDDKLNAIREVMQQVTLSALSESGFFEKAVFYGGTCLRIFHGLQRFSEDMDFSLRAPTPDFDPTPYLHAIKNMFAALGQTVDVAPKKKTKQSAIQSAFLKSDTAQFDLKLERGRLITIKLEIDTAPPLSFECEQKLLLHPRAFFSACMTLPCLFAGKMHALLFRNWQNRVKGRDWYDFAWYISKGIPLNFTHFCARTAQFNSLPEPSLTIPQFRDLLRQKISTVNLESAKADVSPFIANTHELDIWSTDYFMQLADLMIIQV